MMPNPKISVIVPVYNVEKYLPRCIDSILAQTFTDFELLLIDDGSSDYSGKICDEYAKNDERIRVFHQENGGVSSARNIGLDNAKGEWISFVDSDDWLENECYSSLLSDGDIADLTYFGCDCYFVNGAVTIYSPADFYSDNRIEIEKQLALLKNNPQKFEYLGYTWNKLFKKEIIDNYNLRFLRNLTLREDELFTLSYARYVSSIRTKADTLYNYRVIPTGLTHSVKSNKEYYGLAKNILEILPDYTDENLLQLENNAVLCYLFIIITREHILSRAYWNCVKSYIQIGRKYKRNGKITSLKVSISFYFKCILYQYIMTCLITLIYKTKTKYND